MTTSQTGSKLSQSLRRAKSQQTSEDTAVIPVKETVAKPRVTVKARTRSTKEATGLSLVMTSRCWPD
ncbi:hypothetical protein JYT96_01150 [Gammaproteobacteria bacterium AH-315-C21]|nr:hypothetical protein [Gammaproteobacteria bacterium AH-315-C21]